MKHAPEQSSFDGYPGWAQTLQENRLNDYPPLFRPIQSWEVLPLAGLKFPISVDIRDSDLAEQLSGLSEVWFSWGKRVLDGWVKTTDHEAVVFEPRIKFFPRVVNFPQDSFLGQPVLAEIPVPWPLKSTTVHDVSGRIIEQPTHTGYDLSFKADEGKLAVPEVSGFSIAVRNGKVVTVEIASKNSLVSRMRTSLNRPDIVILEQEQKLDTMVRLPKRYLDDPPGENPVTTVEIDPGGIRAYCEQEYKDSIFSESDDFPDYIQITADEIRKGLDAFYIFKPMFPFDRKRKILHLSEELGRLMVEQRERERLELLRWNIRHDLHKTALSPMGEVNLREEIRLLIAYEKLFAETDPKVKKNLRKRIDQIYHDRITQRLTVRR